MKRRLFNFIAAVSLLLCMATGGLWVRSYFVLVHLSRLQEAVNEDGTSWQLRYILMSGRGTVVVSREWLTFGNWTHEVSRHDLKAVPGSPIDEWRAMSAELRYWVAPRDALAGFSHFTGHSRTGPDTFTYGFVGVPCWFLLLIFAPAPAEWVRRQVRFRTRRRKGRCSVCGYDLRATPDRCPECVAVPPGRAA